MPIFILFLVPALTHNSTPPWTSLAESSGENPVSFMCSDVSLPERYCAAVPRRHNPADHWCWRTTMPPIWCCAHTCCSPDSAIYTWWPCLPGCRHASLECPAVIRQDHSIIDVVSPWTQVYSVQHFFLWQWHVALFNYVQCPRNYCDGVTLNQCLINKKSRVCSIVRDVRAAEPSQRVELSAIFCIVYFA